MIGRSAIRLAGAALALLISAGAGAGAGPAAPPSTLRVVAFNVLAPVWSSPVWYPEDMDTTLLETEYRRARITAFLSRIAADTDIVCLQEVQDSEFQHFMAALGERFNGAMAVNDPTLWANYLVGTQWAPNGTAIAIRRSVLDGDPRFRDLPTHGGNHVSVVTGTHAASGRRLRAYSVHLDSERTSNRTRELRAVLADASPGTGAVDVICGDINEDTIIGSASGLFDRAGFVDVLASTGNREATHPWNTTYYNSTRWLVIDHILTRGATPVAGEVLDMGSSTIADEVERIEENFRRTGSDHYPIVGTLEF
jgi:endonuclease/exonuclease/phosphatase family metal-dependent hydrolase